MCLSAEKHCCVVFFYINKPINIEDAQPFDVATAYASQCVPPSYQSTTPLTQRNNLLVFPSKIKNSALSVNLLNLFLVSSATTEDLQRRCGPFLMPYFGNKLEKALVNGDDLTASVLPLAFAHNLTAKKFPGKKRQYVYYFV
uniref:Uncharacterized protein n=1 Tax=Panagrolaimus sp. JU765 TaxID=591449 RepID=A0AC34R369_9BILA